MVHVDRCTVATYFVHKVRAHTACNSASNLVGRSVNIDWMVEHVDMNVNQFGGVGFYRNLRR